MTFIGLCVPEHRVIVDLTKMWTSLKKHVGPYNSTMIFITHLRVFVTEFAFTQSSFILYVKNVSQLKILNIIILSLLSYLSILKKNNHKQFFFKPYILTELLH